ncbi:MAG: cupredoxin family copper-binding protein [Anaerolineae bacterium]|nr:cupredoxin family copper-binding protein [Anaerolineae bacterium]
MMRKLLVLLAAIVPALAVTAAIAAFPAAAVQEQPAPTPYPEGGPGVSGVTRAAVTIADTMFSPHAIVVATGATITWTNEDASAHTVTSLEGWFESGELAAGATFSWLADRPGTFRYYCDIHPQMEGVIIVLPGGAVAPPCSTASRWRMSTATVAAAATVPTREGDGRCPHPRTPDRQRRGVLRHYQVRSPRHGDAGVGAGGHVRRGNLGDGGLHAQRGGRR